MICYTTAWNETLAEAAGSGLLKHGPTVPGISAGQMRLRVVVGPTFTRPLPAASASVLNPSPIGYKRAAEKNLHPTGFPTKEEEDREEEVVRVHTYRYYYVAYFVSRSSGDCGSGFAVYF